MTTQKASAPQNDSRKSHLIRSALHPTSRTRHCQHKAALTPATSDLTKCVHPRKTEKVRWLPKIQGRNKHEPKMEVWDWQVCCLCWFQIYTGQTDRQTISYGAFQGECHPSATFLFPALRPNSALCDESERATIPSSLKDRSNVGEFEEERESKTQSMIHEQDWIEQLKKEHKSKTEKEKRKI